MKAPKIAPSPDCTKIAVESPNVAGETDLDRLARLLDGEDSRRVFGDNLVLPPGFGPQSRGEFIAILIDDAPLGGYRRVNRAFVTSWPLNAQIFAGAILQRTGGEWLTAVGIYDDISAREAPAFLIREAWPILLAKLVMRELDPYLHLPWDLSRPAAANAIREVQSRCNLYNREGVAGFFGNPQDFTLWQIGANWPDWEDRGLNAEKRLGELVANDPEVPITLKEFVHICDQHGLKIAPSKKPSGRDKNPQPVAAAEFPAATHTVEMFTLLRGTPAGPIRRISEFKDDEELETIFLSGSYAPVMANAPLSEKELALVRDYSPDEDAVFSYGGASGISYDLDPEICRVFPATAGGVTLKDLLDHLWWWKAFTKDFGTVTRSIVEVQAEKEMVESAEFKPWPKRLLKLFLDNWEQSAYLYEFRARYKGRYRWDPFAKPWVKLNHTQRGMLASLWPPKHGGAHRIRPKFSPWVLQKMKSIVIARIQHDLRATGSALEERVLEEVKKMARERGLAVPGPGQGRRQKLSWRALQYLDLQYLLGRKIPDNDSGLKHAIKNYEAACREVGWEP